MADATLGTAVLRSRLDLSGLRTGLNQAKGDTQKFATDSGAAIRGIGAAFGAIAASAGVRSYVSFLRSSANLSQQADAANRLFEKSLGRTNQGLAEGAGLVDRLSTRFGVANSVIESSATLLLRQGASLDDIERALTAAGASAAAAGFDISTAFDNVATAVATGRSELLETSGIVTNLGPVTQQYAKSIGKTVDELTQQEIIQARVNAIYKEAASEIEDVDEILQGLPLAQAEVTKQWRTFREDVGGIAAEVITPLTEGLGTVLGYVNDLPEPVKRAGIAMTGAALGATALATGVTAIRTALVGFQALGLLSFGPAGWIVLGVTAVAGLVAVLTGRKDSLDSAVKSASDAFNSGNSDSLTGALDEVIGKFDGDLKTSLIAAQDELRETGRVGVEAANNIVRALESVSAQQSLAQLGAGINFQPSMAALRQSGASMFGDRGIQNADQLVRTALQAGNLEEALRIVNQAVRVLTEPASGNLADPIPAFSGATESLIEFAQELRAGLQRVQIAEFVPTVTPPPAPTPTGTGAGVTPAGTPSDPVVVTIAGGIAGIGDSIISGRPGAAIQTEEQLLRERVERQTRINMLLEQAEINAANNRDAIAIRADTQAALAIATERATAAMLSVEPSVNNLALLARPVGDPGIAVSVPGAVALVPPEVQAVVPAAVSLVGALDGLTAGVGSLTEGSVKQLRGRIGELSELADSAGPEARAALLTLVHNLDVELAELIRRTTPVALASAASASIAPIGINQRGFNDAYQGFRNRDLDRGDGGLADARRINDERQASAERFNDTVIRAGLSFANSIEQGIRTGDPGAIVTGGIGAAGSIAAGLVGGPLGTIITGVLPIITGIFGGLFGGNRGEEEAERRRAAERSRSQVSALHFEFNFNQTNTFTGDLTSSNNQSKLREAGLMSYRDFEQLMRRTVLPRLDGLEAKVAALA